MAGSPLCVLPPLLFLQLAGQHYQPRQGTLVNPGLTNGMTAAGVRGGLGAMALNTQVGKCFNLGTCLRL